jgi:RHS repeat-associated protein
MVFALQVSRAPNVAGGTLSAGNPAIGANQPSSLRYMHHDHLGSVAVVTNETGAVLERLAFDPWGKRRNINGLADTTDSLVGLTTDRGYTEHEHLDEMGIIHMNGRVYDPLIGRFMSADPFIQAPKNLKTFNRYSYVWNNPLKLYDPDGFNALDTTTGSFVSGGGSSGGSGGGSNSNNSTPPPNPPSQDPDQDQPAKDPNIVPVQSRVMPEDRDNNGLRFTLAKGWGFTGALGQDGTINVTAGIGLGAGVKLDKDVKTFGSGDADGTFGFGGVLNITIGPIGCQASCDAGFEMKVNPDTNALSVKAYGVGAENNTCTADCSFSGKFGKGLSIGGNAGVTGSLSGEFRNR